MPQINVLSESEIKEVMRLDADSVSCIEAAFLALATKPVVMPPILSLEVAEHHGEVDVKTAYLPGLPSFTVKMSSGYFNNPKIGLKPSNGLMVVFNAATGLVEAVLLENGYLTDLRTAAAGAVAAKWLSREDSRRVGIVGTGLQARLQLEALLLVRPIETARIWGRDGGKAADCAAELSQSLGIPVSAATDIGQLADESDILVTTTPAKAPLVTKEHLRPGLHITAMGSDTDHKNEIAPAALAAVDLYVCDRRSQCELLGELHHALEAGVIDPGRKIPELGEIIAGQVTGRQSAQDVTLCDLTGTGVQDTAIATLARQRAEAKGAGHPIGS